MAQFFSSFASILVAGLVMGPGDPVGIDDGAVDTEPGPRQVSIELARWEALRAMAELEQPVVPAPGPWAADRQVRIERSAGGIRIRVTWQLEAIEAGWLAGPLVGPVDGMRVESATWRGRELGITHTPSGEEVALMMTAMSRGELELVVFVPADRLVSGVDGDFDVWLMPAVRGEVRLAEEAAPEGRVPELVADGQARRRIDGRFWAGEAQLGLKWVDANREADRAEGPLAVARSVVGLTFGDGEVRGRAHVSWLLRRGQLDRVTIDTAGLGRDLEVSGPNVHEWVRDGDRIDIELKEAADGRIDVDLSWTQGVPSGDEAKLACPRLMPRQAYRTESFMQLARDGELEVLPRLSGWSPVARAELPDWAGAGGDVLGTATATFRRDGEDRDASFELLRFVPLSGPPVVVDVAAYEIATTQEGRSLVQARYDVRNERASHLRVELPEGARMLGVRVNGETVTPAGDAKSARAWRIPLVRSLESVKGALSFPVEVIFIREAENWKKKESRELLLPALDAPVAVSRVRVYLPPKYQNRVDVGDFHRVEDFSEGEGITYGLGVGAGSTEVARADELYREAVSAWMTNDFQRAQSSLDELGTLGASNANIEGLQANLDMVQGRGESAGESGGDQGKAGGQSTVVARRIKDQAKRRAVDDEIELLEKAREAEELEAKGDYDKAEQKLAEAKEIGDRLALLEQSESQEQAVYNQSLSSSSARVAEKKKRKVSRESRAKRKRWGSRKSGATKAGPDSDSDSVQDSEDANSYVLDGANTSGSIAGKDAPPPPPPPEEAPVPEEELDLGDVDASVVISTEEVKSIPVGSNTSRDFTAVVDVMPGVARGGRGKKQRRARNRRDNKPKPREVTAGPVDSKWTARVLDPNAPLEGPVATASAVSVHVPAVGEAVLYQHMLLPEGEALTVHLEARRRRNSNRKPK